MWTCPHTGFAAVECGANIYEYSLEQLVVARETAGLEQAHINAPTGWIDICTTHFITS